MAMTVSRPPPGAKPGVQFNPRALISVSAILALWQLLWLLGVIPQGKFPSVGETVSAIATMFRQPFAGLTLPWHAAASMVRWTLGVCLAVCVGVPFGAGLAWFPRFRAATRPIFECLRYIPPLAWVPFAIIILGPSLQAEVFIVFVGAAPPIIINAWTGIAGTDSILVNAARTLGAGSTRILITVALPAAMLNVLTGIRVGVSNGWASLIGAELIGAQSGLGFVIINSQAASRPDDILTGMMAIGFLGAMIDVIFRRFTRRALQWQGTSL